MADYQLEVMGGSWGTFLDLERDLRERTLEQARKQLGVEASAFAYKELRALSFDEAIAYGLEERETDEVITPPRSSPS
ncbi:MAG: hypothetical protein WKF65_13135 [Gaiellaceae bacterium]